MAATLKRGDIVIVSAPGDYGKPRPTVVVQSDWLSGADSVLLCLITSTLRDAPLFRLSIEPSPATRLELRSQIMVDKVIAYPRKKCGAVIGGLDKATLTELGRMLTLMFGLAD